MCDGLFTGGFSDAQILVSHHVELLLPSADFLIRILDGRLDAQGTPAELRAAGELDGLMALEEAEVAKEEPATSMEQVDEEVVAIEGDEKKERKKGPGRKLVQGGMMFSQSGRYADC